MIKLKSRWSWLGLLAVVMLFCYSKNSSAAPLLQADVVSSYGSCSWLNNGDGTSTISMTANFNDAEGRLGGSRRKFWSRGVLIYTFDENGNLKPSSAAAIYVKINNVRAKHVFKGSRDYIMYNSDRDPSYGDWLKSAAFAANVEIRIENSIIAKFPGVVVRAGNFTDSIDVGEITGGSYLSNIGGASCKIVDPSVPPPKPPPAITVDMNVPDWSLGELPWGDSEKTLSGVAQQMCLSYSGDGENSARKFVIDATSENGMSGDRFIMKNVDKPNATPKVLYSVTLDSGVAKFDVPNQVNSAITLNKGNRTCFVPTFKPSVRLGADAGSYSDVLLFTIVTKS